MRIVLNYGRWFGSESIEYDNELMARVEVYGVCEEATERIHPMTAEEMLKWTDERELEILNEMANEIKKVQAKYEKDLEKLKTFRKGIDKSSTA